MARSPTPLPSTLPWSVFTAREAREHGVGRNRLLRSDLRQLRRGLHARRDATVTEADVASALCRAEPDAVVIGLCAARLLGFPLPRQLASRRSGEPVQIAVPGGRDGSDGVVRWSGARITPSEIIELRSAHGGGAGTVPLRLTSRPRTWHDLADLLPTWRLVAIGDHLVRRPRPGFEGRSTPWCSLDELADACIGHRAGELRRARGLVRVGADSPMETLLRLAFVEAGLPEPLINRPIIGADGLARTSPDFQWPEHRLCAEYDGAVHGSADRQRRDILRARAADDAGFTEIRLFDEDVRFGCAPAVARIRAALIERGWAP